MKKIICSCMFFIQLMIVPSVFSNESVNLESLSMKNARNPFENILTGGQPTWDDLNKLKAMGVDTIVNLRTAGEFDDYDEAMAVKALGMTYVSIEVSGKSGITFENARLVDEALAQSKGKSLVHCASSNRVGALFALRSSVILGKSVEASLHDGKNAGLTRLYDKTKSLLEQNNTKN